MTTHDYIGTGFRFPMTIDAQGGIAMLNGAPKIEQSIRLILSTALGERVMRHEFGCGVWDYVFAPITSATLIEIASATRQAITRWEPRVNVLEVTAVADPYEHSKVLIDLNFSIALTNETRNLVYPFYVIPREEAR